MADGQTSISAVKTHRPSVIDDWKRAVKAATVSVVIPAQDAEDLRWYFRGGGVSIFGGSAMSGMLTAAELYTVGSSPCERCGGNPESGAAGSGFVVRKSKPGREPTIYERELLLLLDLDAPDLLPPAADMVCPDCNGHGCKVATRRTHTRGEITAYMTGSSKQSSRAQSVEADVSDLARLGRVSKRLDLVSKINGRAPEVLLEYYSPGGTLGALWRMVPAGKTMLREKPNDLATFQFWENLRERQRSKPTEKRKNQFTAADEQSRELYRDACKAWNWTKPEAKQ